MTWHQRICRSSRSAAPYFFGKNSKCEVPKRKQGGEKGGQKYQTRGLTAMGRLKTQSMTTNQRRRFHFSSVRLSLLREKTSIFFHSPANMSQGKRPHQSFLQWGTTRSLRPSRERTIIFFSTFFLFKHIPFLNRIFRFFLTIYLSRYRSDTSQERFHRAHLVQTILNKKGVFRHWD